LLETFTDVSRLKLAERNLEAERNRAFFYLDLMGHDIHNKLQAVVMGLEVEIADKESEELLPSLKLAIEAAERCGEIIMKVKKTEYLTVVPLEPLIIQHAVAECVSQFELQFNDVELEMTIPKISGSILADQFFGDMLMIFLENSVIHNLGTEKRVWVVLEEEKDGYRISIGDNGQGITDERKADLFDTERRYGGVGLHQTHHIVEKYSGSVEVHDRVDGDYSKGAEFRVWLPKAEVGEKS
jgi:signal transduction histidine kinase